MHLPSALFLVAATATAFLPPIPVPSTKELSRGPAWTKGLEQLAVTEASLEQVRAIRKERSRVAVVAVSSEKGVGTHSHIAAELIRSGLRYSNGLILVDAASSDVLFAAAADDGARRKVAEESDIDGIVIVDVTSDKKLNIQVTLKDAKSKLDSVALSDLDADLKKAAVDARSSVIKKLNASVNADASIERSPKASVKAIGTFLLAREKVASAIALKNQAARGKMYEEALQILDETLAASPTYVEAYILKASCHDELLQKESVVEALKTAKDQVDSSRDELLTIQELEGDYLRFVNKSAFKAYKAYESMVDADPSNLVGLWSMIDVLLTGNGKDKPNGRSINMASELATQIVAYHPNSLVAKQIMSK